jgi:hypothetical protein
MTDAKVPAKTPVRSKTWIVVVAVVLGGFVLPAILYGWVVSDFWSNKPQLKRNFNAEMNASIEKIPPEERAWPQYRAALLKLKPGLDRWESEEFTPESPSWPQIMAFVGDKQAPLAQLRQAAALPHLGYLYGDRTHPEDEPLDLAEGDVTDQEPAPPSENPLLLEILLVPQHWLRKAVPFLIADIRRATEAGQGDVAVADVQAILHIVNHMQQPPLPVSQTSSWNAFLPCCEAIGEILLSDPQAFNEAQLREISEILADFSANCVTLDFEHSRAVMADIEQRRFTDDGQGDGYLYPVDEDGEPLDFFARATIPLAQGSWKQQWASRREHREKVEELFRLSEEDCALPIWELKKSRVTEHLEQITDPRWTLVALLFPDLVALYREGQLASQQADAVRLATTLKRYQLRNGSWPESLDKLIDEFLADIPVDRFDGKPLRYKLVDGAPCIYSVYLDKVDDGGRPAPETDPNATIAETLNPQAAAKGDLILWPALKATPAPVEDSP